MKIAYLLKWSGALVLLASFIACSSSSDDPREPEPEPVVTMHPGESYSVSADDRLVTTSLDPARIQVVLELDESSGTTRAEVTLLEGEADLFR